MHRVSLKKLPFTVVKQAGEAAEQQQQQGQQPGAADGPAGQQQQEGSGGEGSGEEGGSGSEGDEELAKDEGAAEERQQQPGCEPDPQPPSGSDDDEGSGSEGEGEEDEGDDDEEEAAALDAFSGGTAAAVEAFAAAVESDPGAFLQPAPELASLAKSAAKALYDYQAAVDSGAAAAGGGAAAAASPGALPELYIEGFDAEQIWLQLELAAGPALKRARKLLRKVGQEPQLLTPETEEAIDGGWLGCLGVGCAVDWLGLGGWGFVGCE